MTQLKAVSGGLTHVGSTFVLELEGIRIRVAKKRVKNVNFRIGPNGDALMSVPARMSMAEATRIATDHLDWFRAHLARARNRRPQGPATWTTGEVLFVWGEPVTMHVEECVADFGCALQDGVLLVRVPRGSTPQGRSALVERWLRGELRNRLADLLPACERRVGRSASSVTLRRMKSRWGSCTSSTGRIRLNVALAECPPPCLEMVLVHELCHLIEANHGPRFHALMDLHCPDWRVAQRWLNEHPPRTYL